MTVMSPTRLRDPYFIYRYRHRLHVLRTSLALAITFAVILTLQIPHGSWALVSTMMVMGNLPHIGGVIDKGGQRLLGTVLGAIWGILLVLIPAPAPWVVPAWTLIGIAVATHTTFATRYGYSALMFGVTLLMVVGDGHQDLGIALWRAFDVLIGTSIGILATLFILPQKATDLLRFLLADNLDKLARLYHAHTNATQHDDVDTRQLLKSTTDQLVKQRGLVDAIHSERRLHRDDLERILSLERRMLSTIELLLETHWATRAGHDIIAELDGLRDEQHRLARALGSLAFQVRTGQAIDITVVAFDLQRHAQAALEARGENDRALFSPSGYLWLNRELARLTQALIDTLQTLDRLPSARLRRRASRHTLIRDRLAMPLDTPRSDPERTEDDAR
ncbi:FUSC family protein [Chromohalobacter sp. 11-W]|uniref:FUSC family protein n=1 Tax=Chromohalobacter sp. 11-W TaxID=2994061 RepID=UPI002468CE5E|nr:FUSC family protein [Chromohalobacter sp. 11-W]